MKQDLNATINEYLPLRDVVFHTLRQAILRGELEPGERPAMMKYTQDPRGQVIGEWRNIIIDPDAAVDLLK